MRTKDYDKKQTILQTAGEMINTEGIASVSMSKVAKAANISSSTIYVYFNDKDDMLKQIYLYNKNALADFLVANVPESDSALTVVTNFAAAVYQFGMQHYEQLLIIEQFSNSPMLGQLNVSDEEALAGFQPFFAATDAGIAKGELKAVTHDVILTFAYQPIIEYVKGVKKNLPGAQNVSLAGLQQMVLAAVRK